MLCCLVEAFESQLQGLLILRITVGGFSLNGPRKKKKKRTKKRKENYEKSHIDFTFISLEDFFFRVVKHSVDPECEQKNVFHQLCKGKGLFTLYIT